MNDDTRETRRETPRRSSRALLCREITCTVTRDDDGI